MLEELKIHLRNIWKYYDGKAVLRDVNLSVLGGRVVGIIGNSGAGKTTLLKIVAGLEKQDRGDYYFDGRIAESFIRKKVTMVFQKPVVFNTSVHYNIKFGLKIRGFSKTEMERRVRDSLRLVKLEGYEKRRAKNLSGGEQQRLAIARALAIEPEVILLDEPTANLDPFNVRVIEQVIREISEKGVTVIFSTHNIFQARRIAEEIVHIHDGKIVEVGDVEKVFNNPENEITRKFVSGELIY
jgi:tungstate transport system ATP-binding protein